MWQKKLTKLLKSDGSVIGETLSGGIWGIITNFGTRFLQLLKVTVAAAVLPPASLGSYYGAVLAIGFFRQLTKFGSEAALIQMEDDIDKYLDSVLVLRIFRGIIIVVLTFFSSPIIADLFNSPIILELIRVIALVEFISALRSPADIYFRKKLNFHIEAVYNISTETANAVVGTAVLYFTGSVWGLVVGIFAGHMTQLFLSYKLSSYTPNISINIERIKDIFNYGRWILLSSILYFALYQGDDIVVGAILSTGSLGIYRLAYQYSNAPASELSQVISNVLFPVYSKIQNNMSELRQGYLISLKITMLITMPSAIGIAVVASDFVSLFFDQDWMSMVRPMQILVIFGIGRSINGINGSVFRAIGIPNLETKISAITLLIAGTLIYPLTIMFGLVGSSAAVSAASLSSIIGIYISTKKLNISNYKIIKIISIPVMASVAMGAIILLLQKYILSKGLSGFILSIVLGIVIYSVIIIISDVYFELDIRENIEKIASEV